ncbi:unnamed protein product, partial [marine sediment metagenome]
KDFEIMFKLNCSQIDVGGFAGLLLCNNPESVTVASAINNQDGLYIGLWRTEASYWLNFILLDPPGDQTTWQNWPVQTDFYFRWYNANNRTYVKVYADEAMSVVLWDCPYPLFMNDAPFYRYLLPIMSRGLGGNQTIDLTIENLSVRGDTQ